jgi:3D (Asp-Asp-Asp) domain-containing protein
MCNCTQRVSLLIIGLGIAASNSVAALKQEGPETVSETKSLKFETVYEFNRGVGFGRVVKAQTGKEGSITKVFKLVKKDGKVVGKELMREERIEPKNTIFHLGKGGYSTNRGSFKAHRVLTMRASAYDPGPHSNGKWAGTTALGVRPRYGIVAVDPRTIPLGSFLYVEGYGFAYAADTGGAIKGDRIDLCMNTVAECYRFGRKTVKVHVLKTK